MQINIDVGEQLMIAKPHRTKWGWLIYKQNANGQMEAVGMFTDPSKLLVKVAQLLFQKVMGTELPPNADPEIINRSAPSNAAITTYIPHIFVSIIDEKGDKIAYSSEQYAEELKDEKDRVQANKEMAK